MIEAHVFNEMLVPALKQTDWFKVLHFINGLIAPTFLFISGFVFILASQRKREDLRKFGPAFWRLLGRTGLIWALGYMLHLPFNSFQKLIAETTTEGWLSFYQVDILHCIAVGWLVLLLSFLAIKSDRAHRRWMLISGLVAVLITPLLWDVDFLQFVPAPMAAYLNPQHYSLFPIFPWIGFMLIGATCGSLYLEASNENRESRFMWQLGLIGGGLIILVFVQSYLPFRLQYGSRSWRASPLFFADRLGYVLIFLGASWAFVSRGRGGWWFVLDVSRESLLVYVVHIMVIYRQYWHGMSPADIYGKSLGPAQCMLATLTLVALMALLARAWGWFKQRSLTASRVVSYATYAALLLVFFVRAY
jgi:hypothetical protein